MSTRKSLSIGIAALVLGLVVGSMSPVFAATASAGATSNNPVVVGACGLGLNLGSSMRDAGGRLGDIVAKLTGLTADEVHAKRVVGESLADIAKSEGVSADKVVADAIAVRKTVLDAKVKDGTITQEQADTALASMGERLTERVSSTTMGGGRGKGGGMGGGRGGAGGNGGGCGAGGCTQAAPVQ